MEKDLSDAAINARRAYQREWRKKNPDKAKEYEKRKWERRAAEMEQQAAERGSG